MIIDTDDELAQEKKESEDKGQDPANNGMLTFLSARFYLKAIF